MIGHVLGIVKNRMEETKRNLKVTEQEIRMEAGGPSNFGELPLEKGSVRTRKLKRPEFNLASKKGLLLISDSLIRM